MKFEYLDEEERKLIKDVEAVKWIVAPDADNMKQKIQMAAKKYMAKKERINIRISEIDLNMIKLKAIEEGMPYQTLISSVLHKYVTGKFEGGNTTAP
jgi:predicted DNA binding CopG/RHH family protein